MTEPLRLRELDANFIGEWHVGGYRYIGSLEGAQGVCFQCPQCAEGKERGQRDGRQFIIGAHGIICWFRNPRGAERVPDDALPGPGRWWAEGTSLDDLTFTLGEPPITNSVQLTSGCRWHGFVEHGAAVTR